MNHKEISEIRRRFSATKSSMGKVYGCYVNKKGEIISYPDTSLSFMEQSEKEKYLAIFKKVLSGGAGKNQIDITFSTKQVMESEEHKLLMDLKNSKLENNEAREKLFQTIISNLKFEDTNYLILLVSDVYDVPAKSMSIDSDSTKMESESVFSYYICVVCPVKDGKTELGYSAGENEFKNCTFPQIVSNPELGFMFPSFNDRASDIYNALYYIKNPEIIYENLIEGLFHTDIPMTAPEIKDTFDSLLTESLESECNVDVVLSVHEQIVEKVQQYKESKEPEPFRLSADDVGYILKASDVPDERVDVFKKKCTEQFGSSAQINPDTIVDVKKFEVQTPQVKITTEPEYSCLIETRTINDRKYILIPADSGVTVNGVNVK